MAKKKNMDNVVDQAVSLEEEVLQKDREIVRLKREKREVERENIHLIKANAEAAVENSARVLKYQVATVISAGIAVAMVVGRLV